jgi:hypothetical protein
VHFGAGKEAQRAGQAVAAAELQHAQVLRRAQHGEGGCGQRPGSVGSLVAGAGAWRLWWPAALRPGTRAAEGCAHEPRACSCRARAARGAAGPPPAAARPPHLQARARGRLLAPQRRRREAVGGGEVRRQVNGALPQLEAALAGNGTFQRAAVRAGARDNG